MKYSHEFQNFARDCGYPYENNGSTGEIPACVELIKGVESHTYNTTVEIEDDYSAHGRNKLYINGSDIKKKLGYETFTSGYNYIFNYSNGVLRFNANGYEVVISAQ